VSSSVSGGDAVGAQENTAARVGPSIFHTTPWTRTAREQASIERVAEDTTALAPPRVGCAPRSVTMRAGMHFLFLSGLFCVLPSCGTGGAAEAIRPEAPTAAKAFGEGPCGDVTAGGEPLVVDWKPEQRGDLEIAM